MGRLIMLALPLAAAVWAAPPAHAQGSDWVREHYTKSEYMIPMRDGARLFTSVYEPIDDTQPWPILMLRSPYSVRPYGEDRYRESLGPNELLARGGYIFVYQDVRGCYMSEGSFTDMRPHVPDKDGPEDVDESTDTWDTVEWLVTNLPNDNGRVGMWGISYPGFYAAASIIDHHPALVASSPQAPIADWYFDDFHHHGAFFLPHGFGFISSFGRARPEPTMSRGGSRVRYGTRDGYQFFLDLGSLKNVNERYLHGEIELWNQMVEHPNYDDFWQARNILPHLEGVAPAVMTVGGWFDAEDLYGALNIYRSIERRNPGVFNVLVMGAWPHGGWGRSDGDVLGNIQFDGKHSLFYREHIEAPFFDHFLKGEGELDLPEAYVFETGANQWRAFDAWPPAETEERELYVQTGGGLAFHPPSDGGDVHDAFVSDPAKPVPFTEEISTRMTRPYMTDDQRFAARRPDVLAYRTGPLDAPITLAGPVLADLWVSTSQQDADWVVKLIDVFPPDAEDHGDLPRGRHLSEYQMMVRSEVIRGRFRNSYEHPEPFTPNEPTLVRLPLQDVLHTFEPGHRIMIQIQSTWFPLVDRNPQKWVDNIFLADDADFVKAEHRVYRSREHPTRVRVGVLREGG